MMPGDDPDGVPVHLPGVGWVAAADWYEMLWEDLQAADSRQDDGYDGGTTGT